MLKRDFLTPQRETKPPKNFGTANAVSRNKEIGSKKISTRGNLLKVPGLDSKEKNYLKNTIAFNLKKQQKSPNQQNEIKKDSASNNKILKIEKKLLKRSKVSSPSDFVCECGLKFKEYQDLQKHENEMNHLGDSKVFENLVKVVSAKKKKNGEALYTGIPFTFNKYGKKKLFQNIKFDD